VWMSWWGIRRRRSRPVRFVFAPAFAASGSTVMRGRQLADIALSTRLSEREVTYTALSLDLRDSDLFLTKGALKSLDAVALEQLRHRGNRLFADPVDEALSDDLASAVDGVVAASRTAFDDYRARWPRTPIAIVDHHVDPRVLDIMRTPRDFDEARFGYFGEQMNTIRSKRIARVVDFVQVSTAVIDDSWIARLPTVNVHYGIRRSRALDHHKPFLKGFTAAACHSLILIQHDQAEARRWLPPDYPFWLRSDVTEPAILESIDAIRASYGTAQWREGLEVMRDIADRTSPASIGAQLVSLFA